MDGGVRLSLIQDYSFELLIVLVYSLYASEKGRQGHLRGLNNVPTIQIRDKAIF